MSQEKDIDTNAVLNYGNYFALHFFCFPFNCCSTRKQEARAEISGLQKSKLLLKVSKEIEKALFATIMGFFFLQAQSDNLAEALYATIEQ